jgi:peptidoglycan/LPS O-acetylase OafA/YrhL
MTLERTSRPADFLVSRFSRLFPAYWVAATVTFLTLQLAPDLGESVSYSEAIANSVMFHGLLGIPNIDGVYWTLFVELRFYWAIFLLWLTVGFSAPQRWIAVGRTVDHRRNCSARWHRISIHRVARIHPALLSVLRSGRVAVLYFIRRSFRWAGKDCWAVVPWWPWR